MRIGVNINTGKHKVNFKFVDILHIRCDIIMRYLYCILNVFTEVFDILQGHEFYNPTKKNYIFLRSCYDELKPRTSS